MINFHDPSCIDGNKVEECLKFLRSIHYGHSRFYLFIKQNLSVVLVMVSKLRIPTSYYHLQICINIKSA